MPTHLPFKPGDFKMSLDLDRIDEEDWFETDPSSDTKHQLQEKTKLFACLLYTSPSPRDRTRSRMPSSA